MPHYQIRIDETLAASLGQAFSTLADHQALGRLLAAPVKRIVDGQGDVNGVGSVRQIGPGLVGIQETVTAIETNKSIHYRITKGGFPMRNHQGVMHFETAGTGCRVQWLIDFDMPPLLGEVVSATLKRVLTQGLRRLR
jgi:Polyketide cyclase / dehydrase and lipid transport